MDTIERWYLVTLHCCVHIRRLSGELVSFQTCTFLIHLCENKKKRSEERTENRECVSESEESLIDMFSNHAFSPLWAKTSHFQGGLIGETKSLSTQRKGHVIQLQVPSSLVYHSQCRLNSVKLFNRSQRLSALTCSQRNTKSLRCNCKELSSFNATLDHEYASYPEIDHSAKISLSRQLNAFYRFSRPHTVIGTVVGITSVSLLPVETMSDISLRFLIGLLKALVPAILMNIYVVGLNQLYDVEIDKVNKPDLPLASGEFSMKTGAAIVATFSTLSFAMGLTFQSPPLLSALVISFLLGSAYSIDLPFLRWKKHAFLAATCILSVRALVVQLAFFVHIQKYVLGRHVAFTKSLVFATFFMCFFTAVIALFKDIPDVDGDKHFGIQSFSVQIGQERVFWLCISMLLMAYGAAIVVGASSSSTFSKLVTVLGHSTLASILLLRARSINPMNKESVTSFYMFIWKLFYVEYLLIPFVR